MDHIPKYKRNIYLYYFSDFCFSLLFTIPVWVNFFRQYFTFTQMSLLNGAVITIIFLLQIPTGAFADMTGRKTSMVVGAIIWGLALIFEGFAKNGLMIVIAELLTGVGTAFVSGANLALVYDSLKEIGKEHQFYKVRSIDVMLVQFAIIFSSIIAGYLFIIWKGLPFFFTGIALITGSIACMFFYEIKKKHEYLQLSHYIEQSKLGFKEIFKDKATKNVSLFYILVGGMTLAWQVYFNQIYATSIGYSVLGKSWLFAIIRFVNVIILIRVLHFEKYVTKKNIYFFFPAIILFSSLLAVIPIKALGTFLLFTMTMPSTLRVIVLDKYVNERFNSKYRATALSALNMFLSIFMIIIMIVSGPIIDKFSAGTAYFVMGIIALILILPRGIALSKQGAL
jgi:MFS family permease